MVTPVSIGIDDELCRILQTEADSRGMSLDALLSDLVMDAARQLRRKRIREQSEAVGRYVASNPKAKEFYEFWGTPRAEGLGRASKLRSRK